MVTYVYREIIVINQSKGRCLKLAINFGNTYKRVRVCHLKV